MHHIWLISRGSLPFYKGKLKRSGWGGGVGGYGLGREEEGKIQSECNTGENKLIKKKLK